MDKKNTTIGILLLVTAFTLMVFISPQPTQPPPVDPALAEPTAPREALVPDAHHPPIEPRPTLNVEEEFFSIENEYFRVELTNLGAAIHRVYLHGRTDDGSYRYERAKGSGEPYIINEYSELPALSIVNFPGAGRDTAFDVVESSADSITFRAQVGDYLEVVRRYWVEHGAGRNDPRAYLVNHETIFRNLTQQELLLREFGVNLGTSAPTEQATLGVEHLNFNYFDGDSFNILSPQNFAGGGVMAWLGLRDGAPVSYIRKETPVLWASVKNQFFASIITPQQQPTGFIARPVAMPEMAGKRQGQQGMTGDLFFDLRSIQAGESQTLNATFYSGPKEFRRLEALDLEQDRVMQFGWAPIAFISKLMLSLMVGIYTIIPNYGVAIIITTILIKTLLWPLTAQAARSSKRMARIREPMMALREKYKDDPRKMQAETMKLFKENRVNPVGGCLPIVVQIPMFFALFRMIMSASELRYSEFLWVNDLSAPDTIAYIPGLDWPINILPILMAVTMFYQMRMTPMSLEPAQQRVFKLMPFIFFFFSYTFSSGLVLYWTVQNLLTILQQYLTNRRKDDEPTKVPAGLAAQVEDKIGKAASKEGEPYASPYLNKGKKKKKK